MSLRSLITKYCFTYSNGTLTSADLYDSGNSKDKDTSPCHLNVGLFPKEIYISPMELQFYICSVHNEIIFILLKYLKCSIDFTTGPENFGGRYVNGSWNGILSLFESKEADFIPHSFSALNNRTAIIHFDSLHPEMFLLTIFSFPKFFPNTSLANIFVAFSGLIWLLIVTSLLAFGFVNGLQTLKSALTFSWNSLGCAFVDVFGILVGQGDQFLTGQSCQRFNPLVLFALMSLILRQLFSTDITALILSRSEVKLNTFSQLGHYNLHILIEEQSNSLHYFEQLFPQYRPQVRLIDHDEVFSETTMYELIHSNVVLIVNGLDAEMMQNFYSAHHFHISEQGFVASYGHFAIRKTLDESMKRKLSRLMKQFYWFGLETKIDRRVPMNVRFILRNLNLFTSNPSKLTTLRSRNLLNSANGPKAPAGPHLCLTYIYLYLIGIALSVVVLLGEMSMGWAMKNEC